MTIFPSLIGHSPPMQELFKQTALVEPPLLQSLLRRNQGNRASAALQIGIHRATCGRSCGSMGSNDPGPRDHMRSTRLSNLSDGIRYRVGAGGRYGSSCTGRKFRCAAR